MFKKRTFAERGFFLFIFLGLVLCGCMGSQPDNEANGAKYDSETSAVQTLVQSQMELDIRIPSTIATGDLLNGSYYMKYNGTPFKGIVLYCESREGFDEKYCSMARGIIENIDFDIPEQTRFLKDALHAFKIDENGYSCCTDYFYYAGTYTYSMSVYDCAAIETELNVSECGGSLSELDKEALFSIRPIATLNKSILVSEGKNVSQCKLNSDCTEPCAGCLREKQICNQAKELCMDCFMNSMCKPGYKCEQNECVAEEQ